MPDSLRNLVIVFNHLQSGPALAASGKALSRNDMVPLTKNGTRQLVFPHVTPWQDSEEQ